MSENDAEFIKRQLVKVLANQNALNGQFTDLKDDVKSVMQTVTGNEKFGQPGLVAEMKEVKQYITNDRKMKNKFIGAGVVLAALWGVIVEVWKKFA